MPSSIGAYINATVQGVPLYFTVDTGTSQAILNKKIFEKIPKLLSVVKLDGAGFYGRETTLCYQI